MQKNLIMSIIAIGVIAIYVADTVGCATVVYGNITVYGNCRDIVRLQEQLHGVKFKPPLDDVIYITPVKKDVDMPLYPLVATTSQMLAATTTTAQQTTSTTTLPCPSCVCEICTKCPSCEFTLDSVQVKWFLNLKPTDGLGAYQSGYHDCADDVREYLEVPGRPRFKSRPSSGLINPQIPDTDDLFCFKDLGGYFVLNRTPDGYGRKRWGWNDDNCLKSWLRVNHL